MLEWHYQNLIFNETSQSRLLKQHAASVINILDCGNVVACLSVFADLIEICLCKWFSAAAQQCNKNSFEQKILLSACLHVATKFIKNCTNQQQYTSFIENYFRLFLESQSFIVMCKEMR